MALVEQIKIHIDDNEIKDYLDLTLQQSIYGHHTLEIICRREDAFENVDGVILDKSIDKLLGGKITLFMNVVNNEKLDFEGIVTGVHASVDEDRHDTITIEASSIDILLDDGEHCRSFQDKTLKAIVEKVLNEYHFSTKKVKPVNSNEVMAYTVQYKESTYDFLSRIAFKKGEWFFYDGKNIVFGDRNANNIELVFGTDLFDFDVSLKLNDLKFRYISYDYLKNEKYEADSDSQEVGMLSKQAEKVYNKSEEKFKHETISLYNHVLTQDKEEEHLMDRVEMIKKALASDFVSCSGSSDNAALRLGGEIKILSNYDKSGKKLNSPIDHGSYIITGLTHSCGRDGYYHNDFTAIPISAEVPPNSSPHAVPFCETQSAIVMDNNDPEKLGRVQVQFFWQKPENTVSPWLRIVTPHSGKDQGFFFTPEIGDEVLVAFEGGNAEKPYIIGSHYHGKAKPDQKWINDNNDIKGIRTRGGHTIEFVDKDGGEELKIYDNKNDKYEITLSAHSSTVTIKSKGDLNLKAEGDIKIEAGSNLNLKAGSNMEVKAGNDLKTSAMNATSEASVKMELKASASMKIDGGAQLEQKAAIIRIN